jgi:undecaprenyl pyrophosphate synthase
MATAAGRKERHVPRPIGHRNGMKSVREVVEGALEVGIEVLSLFAFSRENWQRPPLEVSALMSLLEEYIARETDELAKPVCACTCSATSSAHAAGRRRRGARHPRDRAQHEAHGSTCSLATARAPS